MSAAIEARAVSKCFQLRHNRASELKARFLGLLHPTRREQIEQFWALRDVSLAVGAGETVGLIGKNGSGKSTFLKLVAGIHRPTRGQLCLPAGSTIGTMIELGVGFHPELTGRENVFLSAAIHGLSRERIDTIYPDIVAYAELSHFMDVPIKSYSSGMHMRLGFAIAAMLDPEILLLDEIFAVGDAEFQRKCLATLRAFESAGKTVLFVSHSPAAIQAICHRACVLDQGVLVYDGDVDGGLSEYRRIVAARDRVESTGGQAPATAGLEPTGAASGELAWHRTATGAPWDDTGRWAFALLRSRGLEPSHFVLDIGCGSLAIGVRLLPFLERGRYWGFETNRDLLAAGMSVELPRAGLTPEHGHYIVNDHFDLGESPHRYDYAVAASLFPRLSLNRIALCVAQVTRRLQPGGQFIATWLESPTAVHPDPIRQSTDLVTYPDREPYHYSFAVLESVCRTLGAQAERLEGTSHPRGESILVITQRAA